MSMYHTKTRLHVRKKVGQTTLNTGNKYSACNERKIGTLKTGRLMQGGLIQGRYKQVFFFSQRLDGTTTILHV